MSILYHQVSKLNGLGVKIEAADPGVSMFKPGISSDVSQGGWVTPGRYTLSFDPDVLGDRLDEAAARGEMLMYKIISRPFGSLPFTNDNFTIPNGWDYTSGVLATSTVDSSGYEGDTYGNSLNSSGDGELIDPTDTYTEDRATDSIVVTLSDGDTLVVGIGTYGGTLANPAGSDGFTVHCATHPGYRALPFGQGTGSYDADVWSNFKTKVTEGLSALPYSAELAFNATTVPTIYVTEPYEVECDGEVVSGVDCSSYSITRSTPTTTFIINYLTKAVRTFDKDSFTFEQLANILYNTAIRQWQTHDTSSAYSISDYQMMWKVFKYACYNAQYGSGDWCEGINAKRHMAHGVAKASVKRHLAAMKLFFFAAVMDATSAPVGTYTPAFEGLWKMASVAQTMRASYPSVISYGRFNQGSNLTPSGDTYNWVSGITTDNVGPTGRAFIPMYADKEYRQAGMAIKLWFAKLLGMELPTDIEQFLHVPQNGVAITDPWGVSNSRFGHISSPNGLGSCWSDEHNLLTAEAMQWLWMTGEYDHTSMMQWFTKNINFYAPYRIHSLSGLPMAFKLMSNSVSGVQNLQSADDGSGITLTWADALDRDYEVYQVSVVSSYEGATHPDNDLVYGSFKGDYELVATTSDLSARIAVPGDGTYRYVVRATSPIKSRNTDILTHVVSGSTGWEGSSVTDSRSGISWDLSNTGTVGVFVDGSPWVLGPAIITGSNADADVVDLEVGQAQPFDPRGDNYDGSAAATWPLTLSGGSSVISTVSGVSGVSGMGILTVVSAIPHRGDFRPAPYAGAVKLQLNTSDVSTSTFASSIDSSGDMFLSPNSTRVETYSYRLDDVWYYGDSDVSAQARRKPRPRQMPRNSTDAAIVFHEAALLLHSSDADKDLLLNPMVQQCIDMVGSYESAAAAGARPNPVVARSAGVLLKRFQGLSGSYLPAASGTLLDSRVYLIDTADDRSFSGTTISGVSASGVRSVSGDAIGWTVDNTTSTYTGSLEGETLAEYEGFDQESALEAERGDTRWAAAETLSMMLFGDAEADYGNDVALAYGHQNASRPVVRGGRTMGELASPFMRQSFDSLQAVFTSGVTAADSGLPPMGSIPGPNTLQASGTHLLRNVIDQPGYYSNFRVNGTVHIRANDVHLYGGNIDARNENHCIEGGGFSGLRVENCNLTGSTKAAVNADSVIVRGCTIYGIKGNGLNIGGHGSLVEANYFDDIATVGDGNYYGVVVNEGSDISIEWNYFNTPYDASGSKVKNCVRIRPAQGNVLDVTVSGNWFRGGTGPAIRVGAYPSAGYTISGIQIVANRFSQESGTTEAWSIAAPIASGVTTNDNKWWNPQTNSVVRDVIDDPDYSAPGSPSPA